jgi:hypothetical protein
MKKAKKPVVPAKTEAVAKFYADKSSVDKIEQMTKALNAYCNSCENASKSLKKDLEGYIKTPVIRIRKPQDPFEIEVIGKYFKYQSSIEKIQFMIKALNKYHTSCGNAVKKLTMNFGGLKKAPVRLKKSTPKRKLKKR